MNPRLIKTAAIIAAGSLLSAAASLLYIYQNEKSKFVGNLVFAETNHPDNAVKEIIIRQDNQTVTLIPDNNFWRIKEADYYYAAFDVTRRLYQDMHTSRFTEQTSEESWDEPTEKDTHIKIIGENGKTLNHLILKQRGAKKDSWQARLPNNMATFTVSGNYNFPVKLSDWTQQPLLALETKDIQQLKAGNKKVSRKEPSQKLINSENLERQLLYLTYDKVMSAQNFDDTLYPDCRNLSFTLFSGLIYSLDICTDNHEYWSKLTLLTTPLPTTETNDYIKHNAFLYDGWFFKLPERIGRLLYQYHL